MPCKGVPRLYAEHAVSPLKGAYMDLDDDKVAGFDSMGVPGRGRKESVRTIPHNSSAALTNAFSGACRLQIF